VRAGWRRASKGRRKESRGPLFCFEDSGWIPWKKLELKAFQEKLVVLVTALFKTPHASLPIYITLFIASFNSAESYQHLTLASSTYPHLILTPPKE